MVHCALSHRLVVESHGKLLPPPQAHLLSLVNSLALGFSVLHLGFCLWLGPPPLDKTVAQGSARHSIPVNCKRQVGKARVSNARSWKQRRGVLQGLCD